MPKSEWYFECPKCGKWCLTPYGFDERIHFVQCECGFKMLRTHGNPKQDAMPERDEIVGLVIKQ